MSNVITNKQNTDIIDLTIEQAGTSRSEFFTEEPLLDATRDYVCGCVELCVPLSEEPMITFNTITQILLVVRRRRGGVAAGTVADDLAPQLHGIESFQLNAAYRMYSPTDFISYVGNWCATFSDAISSLGLGAGAVVVNDTVLANHASINRKVHNGVPLLRASITSSGVLQLVGSRLFWRNFYIDTTLYGRTLLGMPNSTICMSVDATGALSEDPDLLIGAGVLTVPNIPAGTPPIPVNADYSIFRYLEERMYISLEIDLSLPWNTLIRNGKESKTHQIASYPFENKYSTTVESSDSVLGSAISIEMDTHISRFHFQRKTDPNFSWYPVQSSYMVQNARLQLYITRRRFRYNPDGTGTWYSDKKPVNIHDDAVWNSTIKFVSVY